MKHTHRGHCQACGRIQAVVVRGGLIAKHGYTVDGGYFSGTCQGSGELPLEISRAYTDTFAASCERSAEQHDDVAGRLAAGAIVPPRCSYGSKWDGTARGGRGSFVEQWKSWEESDERHRAGEVKRQMAQHAQHADFLRAHARRLRELADRVYGQELLPAEHRRELRIGDAVRAYGSLHTIKSFTTRGRGRRYVVTADDRLISTRACKLEEETTV